MSSKRLKRSFFLRPTLEVAEDLIGKVLVFGKKEGIITETEAYTDDIDEACHAFRGKTSRNAVMFEEGGRAYVYFIYGMYHCLNFVTEEKGRGCAVLIRGVYPFSGPGKVCKEFGIDKKCNGLDICKSDYFYIEDRKIKIPPVKRSSRIGIQKSKNLKWRFFIDTKKLALYN